MKKYKSVYLYNIGRLQEDFEYLFSDIKILKYIVEDRRRNYNGIECEELKFFNKKDKNLIIICARKDKELTGKFIKKGFVEEKDFMYLEDFGKILDVEISNKVKKNIEKLKKINLDTEYYGLTNSEMLRKIIYTDPKYSVDCDFGFKFVQIQEGAFVYPCCKGWATEYIGNLYHEDPNEIWNSIRAKLFRLSLINKTYTFCDLENCPLQVEKFDSLKPRVQNVKKYNVPKIIAIAFDNTCNLKCRSCRLVCTNYNNDRNVQKEYDYIIKKLFNAKWFSNTTQLTMSNQGEALFSKAYGKILDDRRINNLDTILIHTNGILMNQERIDQISSKSKNVHVYVSMDAVNEESYKKIRIGGNINILKRNMELLAKAKKDGKIREISILCVLQKDNYKELPELAKYAIALKANRLDVTRILNWGTFTDEEFKEISMYDEKGNPKPELLEVLNDPIFESNEIKFIGCVFKDKKGIN